MLSDARHRVDVATEVLTQARARCQRHPIAQWHACCDALDHARRAYRAAREAEIRAEVDAARTVRP